MKKIICMILTLILACSVLSVSAAETSNALLVKMRRQLQVGSGLTGSFVIHGNVDNERYPLLSALLDTEFEIRSIRSGDNLHAYIFQPGDNDSMTARNELFREDGTVYLRSDMLDAESYMLPDLSHFIDLFLHAKGENPSVFTDLLKIILTGKTDANESVNTEMLEKQLGDWINLFPSDRTIQRGDDIAPRLTQVYSIPVESMFKTVSDLIRLINRTESAMKVLRSYLNGEQIDTYFNPDLAYYYEEAMSNLDLKGNIVYSRTVSTMGEVLMNSLTLPMSESKTGFSALVIRNDEKRMRFELSGSDGICIIDAPVGFDPLAAEYDADLQYIRVHGSDSDKRNYSLRIHLAKTHIVSTDPDDETLTHETDHYTLNIVRDTDILPEGVSEDRIPDFGETKVELELHFSSKEKPSSRTYLEFSFRAGQDVYRLEAAGKMNSEVPWAFSPFDPGNTVDLSAYSKDDFIMLRTDWVRKSDEILTHTPGEIMISEPSADDSSVAGQSNTPDPSSGDENTLTDGEAESVPLDEEMTGTDETDLP